MKKFVIHVLYILPNLYSLWAYCMVQCIVWYSVLYGTVYCMVQCTVWYSVLYGRVYCMVKCIVCYSLLYVTVYYMVRCIVWYSVLYGTVNCMERCIVWPLYFLLCRIIFLFNFSFCYNVIFVIPARKPKALL